jgi:flagellar biosynthesis protein FliQ
MTPETVMSLGQQAVWLAILIAAPLLIAALATGLVVSVFQAATQINEMTLSFIPKLLAMFLTLMLAGPWILQTLVTFMRGLFTEIPWMIG